jgi:hypothetical protein
MSTVTKPPATTTTTASVQESEVTTYLYIKPSKSTNERGWGSAQSLEKEAVLRRIRHKRRVDRVRNALSSFLKAMPEPREIKDGELVVDDAFSSP